MGSEIERIVGRKSIRGRVHYLVVWRGFGEESNTWESRMDLVADGYASVIRDYENNRKDTDEDAGDAAKTATRSPSRGRSPARGKSPAKATATTASATATPKSTSRPRGRPRSNSATRRRSSSKGRDGSESTTDSKRKATTETTSEAALKQALDQAAATPVARAASSPVSKAPKKTAAVQLAYESSSTTETVVTTTTTTTTTSAPVMESPKKPYTRTEAIATEPPTLQDLWLKLNEGNWLLGFVSVVVVAGSLLASQVAPAADEHVSPAVGDVEAVPSGQWRLWLPFLTPLVALLLVFHQRDARAFAKWIAIALSWRVAAELSIFFDFAQVALGAVGVAYTALVVALISIARSDDLRSKSTLVAFVVGALLLALSDSWIAQTENVALPSRVNLMSASALVLALSPRFTASVHED